MFPSEANFTFSLPLLALFTVLLGWALILRRKLAAALLARQTSDRLFRLSRQSDPLTGLPNQMLGRDRLACALSCAAHEGRMVAVAMIDLHNFKTINDSVGRPIADAAIRLGAARLVDCLRQTDRLSHWGGDQFLVVSDELTEVEAVHAFMTMIIDRLSLPMTVEGYELVMSPAIGFAMYPQDGIDYEALSHKAEIALTYAKKAGRNTYRSFSAPMEERTARRLNLHNDLRVALEREQLVLHYQPQIRLSDGKVVGIEALLRWNHPDHGIIPPGEFIPIAERCGLIIPLGEWVLHKACRQTVKWQEQGMPPTMMAVNVSAPQFRRGNLEKIVCSALAKSGLAPRWLEIEMTEALLVEDADTIKGVIGRLAKRGIQFSIDDFGTGYSSLAYLKQFSVDKLKIDRSFISDLDHNIENLAIVKAILQIAQSLGLETIAEGVEDGRTLALLQNEGCGIAQGYYFSKPVPADELERFMMARSFQ